jgi:hypothetical protein
VTTVASVRDFPLPEWRTVNGCRREKHEGPREGNHTIDTKQSEIQWIGRNLTGWHAATLKLLSGAIEVENGNVARGAFTIDMHSIEDKNINEYHRPASRNLNRQSPAA